MAQGKFIPKYIAHSFEPKGEKMTREEVKKRFDNETAQAYSQRKPVWLPEHAHAFSLIAKAIKPFVYPGCKILDLGAGTGNLSRTVFESYPDSKITLVDFSANMLEQVPEVLTSYKSNFTTVLADIFQYRSEPGSYQNVISSFAIHHARGCDEYLDLYKKIFTWIKTPGMFICCDVVNGSDTGLSELNEQNWRNYLLENGLTGDDADKILANYHREDSPLSVFSHLELLKESGFQTVDVLWKKYNFCLYAGIKKQAN